MQTGSVGQLLVNEVLPEELRDTTRVLNKKALMQLHEDLAARFPDRYREVSHKLSQIGQAVAQETGGMSFGLRHLRKSAAGVRVRDKIQRRLQQILAREDLSDRQRDEQIIKLVGGEGKAQQEAIYNEALKAGNPLGTQVLSGSRGNPMNLASLLGSDLLYTDHRNRPIPVPVLRSYSEGLSPEEYWAGAYGARKGLIDLKMSTADAGFLGKQLNQVAHRLLVTADDYEDEEQRAIQRGFPVDTDDMDNAGALLASDVGPYKKDMVLTPKILKHLLRLGKKQILVRSTAVGGSPEGGVYAKDAGLRENGTLPGRGEEIGMTAAQAISNPLTQAQISSKHTGGVAGEGLGVSSFDYINQLVQIPKKFKEGAAHATLDGTVQRIENAPAGGQYVTINDQQHYVSPGYALKVKKGDTVEAGDVISEGTPNPAMITQYKGIGEGRRYFVDALREAMKGAGMIRHRRNIELLARGLINHVSVQSEFGDYVPGDVIPYSTLEHTWQPREGHEVLEPRRAVGRYLERPVLHYTIGTQIKPSMLKQFDAFGVKNLAVHAEPPPFAPQMIRGMESLTHDPDWLTRQYGSGLKKGLLQAVHRGGVSDERGTSFVPGLARGVNFGRDPMALVHAPEPGTAMPTMNLIGE